MDIVTKMLSRTQRGRGCWEWKGYRLVKGYGQIRWKGKSFLVHRVMFAEAFGFHPLMVCHQCDNPSCIRPSHLAPGDQARNMRERDMRGRTARGKQIGISRLSESDVLEMRRRLASGSEAMRSIARDYQVTWGTAWSAMTGKTWRHLGKE